MVQGPTNGDNSTDIEAPPDETLMLFDDEENSQFVVAYTVDDQDSENIHVQSPVNEEPIAGPSCIGVETENVTGHRQVGDELTQPNNEDARFQAMVENAPILSNPLRAPRGRRRRELLSERQDAANNAANQLGQTLNALIDKLNDRQNTQETYQQAVVAQMTRTNDNLERMNSHLSNMFEEQKKDIHCPVLFGRCCGSTVSANGPS
ncbi:uncharacterized protein [Aquarana catesbeiana]|uniref:uncharacterized protein n=1 Tax=Aquarana catesbeiana TaxID=8400 RepID=UPI003CC99812